MTDALARARALLDAQDPEGALEALGSVATGGPVEEVAAIRSRALFEVGRRNAVAGAPFEALEHWERALEGARPDLGERIAKEAATLALERARAWQSDYPDEAIRLLEQAVSLGENVELQRALAEQLTQRGIQRANALLGRQEVEGGLVPDALLPELEAAFADLRKGELLGSARAAEQGPVLRGIITRSRRRPRKPTTVEFNSLTPAQRQRFVDSSASRGALGGKAGPRPILFDDRRPSIAGPVVLTLIAVLALLPSLAHGFGTRTAWAGPGALAWYGALVFTAAAGVLEVLHARARRHLTPYREGRYLFGTDIVLARGGELSVQPLSSLEKLEAVHHHRNGAYSHTLFTFRFPDRVRHEFTVRKKAEAEAVAQALSAADQEQRRALAAGDFEALEALDPLPGLR